MAVRKTPVEFELPDGDVVALIPWAYVVQELTEPLSAITTSLANINSSLTQISDRLDDWMPE